MYLSFQNQSLALRFFSLYLQLISLQTDLAELLLMSEI